MMVNYNDYTDEQLDALLRKAETEDLREYAEEMGLTEEQTAVFIKNSLEEIFGNMR